MPEQRKEGIPRPLNPWMRRILYAASALVFLAGFQLFILTEYTRTYFAWDVLPPLTAASLGAAYWASVLVELSSARGATWAKARVAVPGVWAFTALTLIVTLLHFDRFHFSRVDLAPRAAAWLWLGIYAGVPLAMLLAALLQRRTPGTEPPREKPFPTWLRAFFLVEGSGMAVMGAALLVAPGSTLPLWPWLLTPLTARAIGAWFVALAVVAFCAYRENDLSRIRPVGGGFTVFSILELVALARYPADMNWASPGAWIYTAFLLSLLPAGLYAWRESGGLDMLFAARGRRAPSGSEDSVRRPPS